MVVQCELRLWPGFVILFVSLGTVIAWSRVFACCTKTKGEEGKTVFTCVFAYFKFIFILTYILADMIYAIEVFFLNEKQMKGDHTGSLIFNVCNCSCFDILYRLYPICGCLIKNMRYFHLSYSEVSLPEKFLYGFFVNQFILISRNAMYTQILWHKYLPKNLGTGVMVLPSSESWFSSAA